MEQRFNDFRDGKIDMRNLHPMVYDTNNVSLALRQLSNSKGRFALGPDGTNIENLKEYSINDLAEIVKNRLINKEMSYVRRTYIPKGKTGKLRPIGLCSIWDKLVEKCIQLVIEPYCETKFVPSSFGFREQVSAHNALAKVKNQCQTMPFVLSVDMKDYFGTIDPDIAYREMWHIGIKDQVILNCIFRFIKKGYFEDSCKIEDPRGTAQGSILGPLISNIYLHRFDVWLREQGDCWHDPTSSNLYLSSNKRMYIMKTGLKLGVHARYADDILVLCKTRDHAERFRHSVTRYLTRNLRLVINEEKTRIYDLTQDTMKYLGYDFQVVGPHGNVPQPQSRNYVKNTLPKAKEDEIVDKCKTLLKAIKEKTTFENVHNWNAYVVGIHNYYMGLNEFQNCFAKIGWRTDRLFYHVMNKRTKFTKEQSYKNCYLGGRYSSWGKNGYYCYKHYPIIKVGWGNWNAKLIAPTKGKVTRENPYAYGEKKHKPGVSMEDIDFLVETSKSIKNSRYAMFRISKYSSTKGISYLSGKHVPVSEYHCHYIKPRNKGGTDDFCNLCVLSEVEWEILSSETPERLYAIYPRRKKRIDALIAAL
jgi:group II intron reverse transcriptase/maturase